MGYYATASLLSAKKKCLIGPKLDWAHFNWARLKGARLLMGLQLLLVDVEADNVKCKKGLTQKEFQVYTFASKSFLTEVL